MQLAIEHGTYGVHLAISTHGSYEFILAEQAHQSYLAVGAVFETPAKDMIGQIQGVNNLQQLVNLNGHIPLVAISGITLDNATDVIKTRVNSIAVVTAITRSNTPEKTTKKFQRLFSKVVNTRD